MTPPLALVVPSKTMISKNQIRTLSLIILFLFLPSFQAEATELKNKLSTPLELSNALDKVVKLNADSYQVLLREASLLIQPVFQGQDWTEVQTVLQKQHLTVIDSWENGDFVHRHYLLKSKAFKFSNGHSLDMCLLISVPNGNSHSVRPALAGKVTSADVALVADINAPYPQVMAKSGFPKGSVLDLILSSEDTKKVGKIWPLLKKISVHYGIYRDMYQTYNPSGFHVCVAFTASTKEKIADKMIYFFVMSGLDPLRSSNRGGISQGFQPQDTLGEIREDSVNELWYGNSATVQSNKSKYLKAPI